MTTRDVTLLNSLAAYVQDVKPYHTKVREFLSQLFFTDSFNVNVTESLSLGLYLQNIWTVDSLGGYSLHRMCEGIPLDQTFRIPAAVWPRWSLNDHLGQTPPGDDPAVAALDDGSASWTGAFSSSHQLGSDHVSGFPNKYAVSFHQGSRVYVDGVQQTYGTQYWVDISRGFIYFATPPGSAQHLEFQLFRVDRLFISYNYPFDYSVNRDYDDYGYDLLPYDSNPTYPGGYESDTFTITIDHTLLSGHKPVVFTSAVLWNSPKAKLTMKSVTSHTVTGDVWKVVATGPWSFSVQKNGTGPIWFTNFKETFNNGEISFIIDRTWIEYYLIPDGDTYSIFPLDPTDFMVGLNLTTEHGVVIDPSPPLHRPMEFVIDGFLVEVDSQQVVIPEQPIGTVQQVIESGITGDQPYYTFTLTSTPLRGTYVELRVEQTGQLNPWFHASFSDDLYLHVTWPNNTTINQISPPSGVTSVVIPAGTVRLIHNVNLPAPTVTYSELQNVNELVIYHGRGVAPSAVDVKHGATDLGLPMITVFEYFEGTQLPPNYVGVDTQRVIISLGVAQTINVTLTF